MRTRPVRRLAAALLNLLFLLAWGEPALLPPCPTHDGFTAVTSHADQHGPAHSAAAHRGHHGASATSDAMAATVPHADHGDGPTHACRCIGQCCPTAAVVAPTAQAVRWQVVVRRLVEPAADAPTTPAAAAPRLLPFANGPPRTA
jgi:hypothetical protein